MIATISFQVDPTNDAEVEILRRAMRDLEELRRGDGPFDQLAARARTVREVETACDPLRDPVDTTGWSAGAQAARSRPDRPRRDEPQTCPEPGCGQVCGSPQGLAAHRRYRHDGIARAAAPAPAPAPDPVPRERQTTDDGRRIRDDRPHAQTSVAKRRGGWVAWCRCGFFTTPEPTSEDALDALADHVEGES